MEDKDFGDNFGNEFTHREQQVFGELPHDLRTNTGTPENYDNVRGKTAELDNFSRSQHRDTLSSVDRRFSKSGAPSRVTQLPRHNYISYRSIPVLLYGSALLPDVGDAGDFTNLMTTVSGALISSSGTFTVPKGYGGVITGLRQWIEDAAAVDKNTGAEDDVAWRITINGRPIPYWSSVPFIVSSTLADNSLYITLSPNETVALWAKNTRDPGDDIAIRGFLSGYIFPLDEVNDMFRNE